MKCNVILLMLDPFEHCVVVTAFPSKVTVYEALGNNVFCGVNSAR